MSRLLAAGTFLAFCAMMAISARCDLATGGIPTRLRIVADTDSTVYLSWIAPAEGVPNEYIVYFREVGKNGFEPIGSTNDSGYAHNPHGITGTYKVVARFGSQTYDAAMMPTTVPVSTDTMSVYELSTEKNAGYGWSLGSGKGASYAMDDRFSADEVDFYITDFAPGTVGSYHIASPDLGPTDPGGSVPVAGWRVSGFTPALVYEHAPLPRHSQHNYFDRQPITTVPAAIGCYTESGHFAIVKFVRVSAGTGETVVKTWFQMVKGLRLIKH